jgi:muramoyltetrapeptide carboxypeptidase LdcA involved in peptidoglycan recycling
MLDDDDVKAILFGRGGYGLVRIIDQIDFTSFIKSPKWLVGFSDITCLLSHVHTQYNIVSMHAHMSGGYVIRKKMKPPHKVYMIPWSECLPLIYYPNIR